MIEIRDGLKSVKHSTAERLTIMDEYEETIMLLKRQVDDLIQQNNDLESRVSSLELNLEFLQNEEGE